MSENLIEKLAYLMLGWLLGLLGPIIVDSIRRARENKQGRKSIINELREVGCLLAIASFGALKDRGTINRDFIEWLKNDLENHAVSDKFRVLIPNLSKWLALPDETISELFNHLPHKDGTGTVLQHYPVPLLDARVSALWSFETTFQTKLLSIRLNINYLDDLVERSRKYHDMTFSKHEGDNHTLILENFNQSCDLYADFAIKTVKLIRELTAEYK